MRRRLAFVSDIVLMKKGNYGHLLELHGAPRA
jgi:hypothetical protein